jgi:chemotaxis protein MotB
VARRKKKEHHEEHPDERWLITYADVLTLMFVLFMVLFSISVVNTGKFEQLKESLSQAFSPGLFQGGESALEQGPAQAAAPVIQNPASSISPQIATPMGITMANGASSAASLETAQMEEAKRAIDAEARRAGFGRQIRTEIDQRGLVIRLRTDPFLFDSGSADLRPEARDLLRPVSRAVGGLANPVWVEGHTDSNPIRTARFPSNWWLGGGRACAVLEAMRGQGVPAGRMTCASRGDTRPVADNDTPAHRAQNRRVEILVLRTQDASPAPTGAAGP